MTNHHRVSEEGKRLGRCASVLAERGRARLESEGLSGPLNIPSIRDDMCASCACREGGVPNGCLQTQLDFLKAVAEAVPFYCHAPKDGRMCAGYIAARAEFVANPLPQEVVARLNEWEFSPPDEAPLPPQGDGRKE